MKVSCSSETSVEFQRIIWSYISQKIEPFNMQHHFEINMSHFIINVRLCITSYVKKWKYVTYLYKLLQKHYQFYIIWGCDNANCFSTLLAIQFIFWINVSTSWTIISFLLSNHLSTFRFRRVLASILPIHIFYHHELIIFCACSADRERSYCKKMAFIASRTMIFKKNKYNILESFV
jgi:hypothetical protein